MAILSNVNGKFAVDSTGAIQFSGSAGTSGYILRSNGNAAPTWVDSSTVIGGPYLPLTGGTLSGALAGTSATFSGTITTPQINLNSAGGGIIDNQTGNIFIQTPSGTGWIFRNGPSGYDEKMRITSGGDVYIGNSSVTLANTAIFLQKNGIITSVVGSSSTDLIQFYQQNVGGIGTIRRNASGISINGIGQTNQLVVADSGNVGIGTAFPSTTEPTGGNLPTGWTRANSKALEIAAPDFANSGLFLRNSGTTATGTDITGDQYYGDTYIDNRFNNDNGSIYFRTKTAVSPQIRMAIKGSGNVGIGTDSPQANLSIGNNIGTFNGISIGATANRDIRIGQSSTNNIILGWKYNATASSAYGILETFGGSNSLVLQSAGGNVGIGTTASITKLSVHNSTETTGITDVLTVTCATTNTASAGKGAAIRIGRDPDGNYSTKIATVYEQSNPSYLNPAMVFYTMHNSYLKGSEVEKMRITSTGSIFMLGLGGYTSSNADVRFSTASGELYYQTSSKRYKTDIVNLENSLDKINSLRPVRYKDINTGESACGLIAEETVEIIPEVVFTKKIEGFDEPQIEGLNYSDLTPFLIKAIQELEARVKELENK